MAARLIAYAFDMGRLEELRGRVRGRGQNFDELTISEFCDVMWAQAVDPPGMVDPSKWRDAVYEAFYGEDDLTPPDAPKTAVTEGLPTSAQAQLQKMREIRERNMARQAEQAGQ